ncbi:MAG: hypothetical protein V3T77_06070 [Planctomycetota bacterium]
MRISTHEHLALTILGSFFLWCIVIVLLGPELGFTYWIIYPALGMTTLVLLGGLIQKPNAKRFVLFVALVACLSTIELRLWSTTLIEGHLSLRTALTGGPKQLQKWAGRVLERRQLNAASQAGIWVAREEWSSQVKALRPSFVTAIPALLSEVPCVRLEFGKGLFNYGIMVFQNQEPLPLSWFWPSAVQIYHDQ